MSDIGLVNARRHQNLYKYGNGVLFTAWVQGVLRKMDSGNEFPRTQNKVCDAYTTWQKFRWYLEWHSRFRGNRILKWTLIWRVTVILIYPIWLRKRPVNSSLAGNSGDGEFREWDVQDFVVLSSKPISTITKTRSSVSVFNSWENARTTWKANYLQCLMKVYIQQWNSSFSKSAISLDKNTLALPVSIVEVHLLVPAKKSILLLGMSPPIWNLDRICKVHWALGCKMINSWGMHYRLKEMFQSWKQIVMSH